MDKEKLALKKKRYYEKHKDFILAYHKKYRERHRLEACEYQKEYRENNKALLKKKRRAYVLKNKEAVRIRLANYYQKTKEIRRGINKEIQAKSYIKHREKRLATCRKYYKKNRRRIQNRQNVQWRKEYQENPNFNLACKLRARLRDVLKNGTEKSMTTVGLLGCSLGAARKYIESKLKLGMTWKNISIDHIRPCASFDLTDPEQQRLCFNYKNLQPMFLTDNLRKNSWWQGKFIRRKNGTN